MLAAESVAVSITPRETALEQKVNILVVDDQPEGLLAASAVLESLGQNVVKASSGKEALWHLLQEDFAVVLLDVQMPAMDGFETAKLIREREKSSRIPIIFMTAAHTSDSSVFRGYEVGAVDYIFKPVIPEILRSKVSIFVELALKTETIQRQALLLREAERREHEKEMDDALAFSHAVSHDLRAPLRHIQSFSEILVQTYGHRLDDAGRDYLMRLSGAARKMTRLIDAMLQLSQATKGGIQREIVDLSKIVAALEHEFRRTDPLRRVEFSIQPEVTASGDPQLLRLALENLLNNAWKYSSKNPAARIEFGREERAGETVIFVRDNGVGFDMSLADKLFTPFQRLHPRGEFEGTGIGLATVKRVIARHGGRIWAEAAAGKGASFLFALPAAES